MNSATQPVPSETLLDLAVGLMASHAQQAALVAEREALADTYIDEMRDLAADDRDLPDLRNAMQGFRLAYGQGWSKRLELAGLPKLRTVEAQLLSSCNDGEGLWRGDWPLTPTANRPARGTWVVYKLFLGDALQYTGSTGAFAERLKAHSRDKTFDTWRAARCADERSCRELEAALIDRDRPPLNRMIPTPKLVLT